MKKKNGFTLVEILAVIIVLVVIALIVTPLITSKLKSSKEDLYETQLENIKSAAKAFMVDVDLEELGANEIVLTLEELKKTGFIEKEIKNPKTGENFNNCTIVNVTVNNGEYNYEVVESQDNDCNINNDQHNNMTMILLGLKETSIKKGEIYKDAGVLLINNKGRKVSLENVIVDVKEKNNKINSILDSNYNNFEQYIDTKDLYEYEITYKHNNNMKIRTVKVIEDTGLECMILPTQEANDFGWIVSGERKVKIVSINNEKDVEYSLSTDSTKEEYSKNQFMTVPNDGIITLYGNIKDKYGNKASCSTQINYEIENPSCNINLSGATANSNGWYKNDVKAQLNITSVSEIEGYDVTYSSSRSYNKNDSLNISSKNTVYGYILNKAGKEESCFKEVLVDKVKPTGLKLSGTTKTETNYNTNAITLTATAMDKESGIDKYKFYKVNGTTETYLDTVTTTAKSATYTVTNPKQGDSYKVIVVDKAGNENSFELTENCTVSYGSCSGNYKWVTHTCNTGYKWKYQVTDGCITTTTTTKTTTIVSNTGSGGCQDKCSSSTTSASGNITSSCPNCSTCVTVTCTSCTTGQTYTQPNMCSSQSCANYHACLLNKDQGNYIDGSCDNYGSCS